MRCRSRWARGRSGYGRWRGGCGAPPCRRMAKGGTGRCVRRGESDRKARGWFASRRRLANGLRRRWGRGQTTFRGRRENRGLCRQAGIRRHSPRPPGYGRRRKRERGGNARDRWGKSDRRGCLCRRKAGRASSSGRRAASGCRAARGSLFRNEESSDRRIVESSDRQIVESTIFPRDCKRDAPR